MQIKSLKSLGLFMLVGAICASQACNIHTYLNMHHFIMQTRKQSYQSENKKPSLNDKIQAEMEI